MKKAKVLTKLLTVGGLVLSLLSQAFVSRVDAAVPGTYTTTDYLSLTPGRQSSVSLVIPNSNYDFVQVDAYSDYPWSFGSGSQNTILFDRDGSGGSYPISESMVVTAYVSPSSGSPQSGSLTFTVLAGSVDGSRYSGSYTVNIEIEAPEPVATPTPSPVPPSPTNTPVPTTKRTTTPMTTKRTTATTKETEEESTETTAPKDPETLSATTVSPSSVRRRPRLESSNLEQGVFQLNAIQGVKMKILPLDQIESPDPDYHLSDVSVQDGVYQAFVKVTANPLLYLEDEKGKQGFYLYTRANNAVFPYFPSFELPLKKGKAELLPIDVERPHSIFEFKTKSFGTKVTSVLEAVHNGQKYTVVKARLNGGFAQLYFLEEEGTAYQLKPFDLGSLQALPSETPTPSPTPMPVVAKTTNERPSRSFWLLLMALLFLLVLIVVLIILLLKKKPKESWDEAFMDPLEEAPVAKLQELEPNNFDQVDRYFAETPDSPVKSSSASMGVRAPEIKLSEGIRRPDLNLQDK